MILFTILALTLLFLIGFFVLTISAGGAIFTILFSDVIVCAAIIGVIIVALCKKKK